MAARGCGASRTIGGIYAETHLSPTGRPIEDFLIDPPQVVDLNDLGVTPRGTHLIQRNGVYHVFDVVGKKYYPNVADFVEEVKRMGVSRRLSPKQNFSKLTSDSMLVLLHERAFIENAAAYKSEADCPKCFLDHDNEEVMCVRLWWEDVIEGKREGIEDMRAVLRQMPSFSYSAREKPAKVKPKYKMAIFAVFPIHNLAVINDPDGKSHEKSLEKACRANLDVFLEDE